MPQGSTHQTASALLPLWGSNPTSSWRGRSVISANMILTLFCACWSTRRGNPKWPGRSCKPSTYQESHCFSWGRCSPLANRTPTYIHIAWRWGNGKHKFPKFVIGNNGACGQLLISTSWFLDPCMLPIENTLQYLVCLTSIFKKIFFIEVWFTCKKL